MIHCTPLSPSSSSSSSISSSSSSPSSPTMPHQPPPCTHLAAYRSSSSRPSLRLLRRCLRPRSGGAAAVLRDPFEIPCCGICSAAAPPPSPRLYACLSCARVSCSAHAPSHAATLPGHEIAIDIDRAELFCCACADQVYDRDLDAAATLTLAAPSFSTAAMPAEKKRRRVEYQSSTESKLVCASAPAGLRGLNNLGSTCFMNSVLQALLHAPLLRNYFLSDRHNRRECRQKENVRNATSCLACNLDSIYSAVFSGDRTPYSPANFLYSWWQHASNLACYEQQDAHEFFISILDRIHEKMVDDQKKPHNLGCGDCCIAHKVFSGILRSDVICSICGFTSTAYDPCVDISLDLDSKQSFPKVEVLESQAIACNGDAELISSHRNGFSTLRGCLERFTRPERLGSDQKFFCQHCKVRQESLKQMSIGKLPLVTCFHIKRFEHSPLKKMSRKVDQYLQFPFSLDVSPFLSSSVVRSRFGNRVFAFDGDDADISSEFASELELFAIITHNGKLDSGHYVTFLRLNDQWYKCDDSWITNTSESTVRASQAYMLFYVQKMLYYKASESVVAS